MIGYLDTSAFVPLLVTEPGTPRCRRFWDDTDDVATSRLLYVETAAALARAERLGRLSPHEHEECVRELDRQWTDFFVIEPTKGLVERAAALAREHKLRGYDAVHCASAGAVASSDLVVASGDGSLLRASKAMGLATYDTNPTAAAGTGPEA